MRIRNTFLVLICLISGRLIGQTNPDNSEKAYELWGSYVSDFVYNAKGGLKRGSALMGKMDMGINIDFEKAKIWTGGSFSLIVQSTHGGKATGT